MPVEREDESKYLVDTRRNDFFEFINSTEPEQIKRSIIFNTSAGMNRIRTTNGIHINTYKPRGTKEEINKEYTEEEAAALYRMCDYVIIKNRYLCYVDGHKWEIDVFLDPLNRGFVVAEYERQDGDPDVIPKPLFISTNITDFHRLKNANMTKQPISSVVFDGIENSILSAEKLTEILKA